MNIKVNKLLNTLIAEKKRASLTVEAALVTPIFLFFILAFLYFIQIFLIQEQIQAGLTRMGLDLSKTAYIYDDFMDVEDALGFDQTLFGEELEIGLHEFAGSVVSDGVLKLYAMKYLDIDQINRSCIYEGYDGISFMGSQLMDQDGCIDIIVRYKVRLPIKIITIKDMQLIQRVKLRSWTGYKVASAYSTSSEESSSEDDPIVYITETGRVYHKSKTCTHILLSVQSTIGIPDALRNDNGGKYYPCESCCTGKEGDFATYYITSDGTRYHSRRNCSRIKRSVQEIPLSKVGGRPPCKRCGG
ncbi:pilus assembly protein [Lachnospiraceae bacterium MD1]|uniref:Pilus assembly protein n=1 Tax=Variimorphobacter saccharofermentans TaxID=2755051 RepID=A0A839K688_9FIRM|nr:TadE family protein [Variimorphobacter saccharofermentans]MBB2184692.1 pilus assembly protein [Variimorphobacter saccharofermentans]